MKNATVHNGELINVFELILACDDFEQAVPNCRYDVYPGNNCVWISTGSMNLYYTFHEGKIIDVHVD